MVTSFEKYQILLSNAKFHQERSAQYNNTNSVIRSILQMASLSALELCYRYISDIESTDLPELAANFISPTDGHTRRILDYCIPSLMREGVVGLDNWFKPKNGLPKNQTLSKRCEEWVNHRNNRPAHGVLNDRVVHDALEWIPDFADELLEGLSALLPVFENNMAFLNIQFREHHIDHVALNIVRPSTDAFPVVVRSIRPRGNLWQVNYQGLGPDCDDRAFIISENDPFPTISRTRSSKFIQHHIQFNDASTWSPTVLIPSRQTNLFEGRKAELLNLQSWFNDPESRICNVHGEGGIGKTTLVLEFIHQILDQQLDPPNWRPELIYFYSAKETRWGADGLEILAAPKEMSTAMLEMACGLVESLIDRAPSEWYAETPDAIINKLSGSLGNAGLNRDSILLILDNTETLARKPQDEDILGAMIKNVSRKIGRVIVTSRRREKVEAEPIEILPMEEEDGEALLVQTARELNVGPILSAGSSTLRQIVREMRGRPLLLDAVVRYIAKAGVSIKTARESILSLAADSLGLFLFDDAWQRIEQTEQDAFLVVGHLGGNAGGDVLGWVCAEVGGLHSNFLKAFNETHFGALLDYGLHYDINFDPSAKQFLASKFSQLSKDRKAKITTAVKNVRDKLKKTFEGRGKFAGDRIEDAFRTDAAKAAHIAFERGNWEEALRWFEEAYKTESSNPAFLERFAWFLRMKFQDYERALMIVRQAKQLDSNNPEIWFTEGMILARMGKVEQSDPLLDNAIMLGKAAHICWLQKMKSRKFAVLNILEIEPIDSILAKKYLDSAIAMERKAFIGASKNPLDIKHKIELEKESNNLNRLQIRLQKIKGIYGFTV